MRMRNLIALSSIMAFVLVSGCVSDQAADGQTGASTDIPAECASYTDTCELFSCVVPLCWCDDSGPESAILQEGDLSISTRQEAVELVEVFLQNPPEGMEGYDTVAGSAELDSVFFNVFVENAVGDQLALTVASDGTIFRTVCGV